MNEAQPNRRRFLDLVISSTALCWLGSVLYPVLRYMKPLPLAGAGAPITLASEQMQKLAREKYVIVRMGPSRVIVFEDAASNVRALDARCTHEGCTVKYIPEESYISCACHNGRFDLDGRVLAGPPPRPLKQYDVERGPDASVTIATRTA